MSTGSRQSNLVAPLYNLLTTKDFVCTTFIIIRREEEIERGMKTALENEIIAESKQTVGVYPNRQSAQRYPSDRSDYGLEYSGLRPGLFPWHRLSLLI